MGSFKLGLLGYITFFLYLYAIPQTRFYQTDSFTITFPTREEVGDTISFSQIRLAGHLHSAGQVWVNGKRKKIYPTLAFVDLVPLSPGENEIEIVGKTSTSRDTLRLFYFRLPEKNSLPIRPTVIDSTELFPDRDVEFFRPGVLELRFRGSPKGRAEAWLPGLKDPIPMRELSRKQTHGIKGVYQGTFRIPEVKRRIIGHIQYTLQGRNGKVKTLNTRTTLTVYPHSRALVGETLGEETPIYDQSGGSILLVLPAGIRLELIARFGNTFQVSLGSEKVGYVRAGDFRLLPEATRYEPALVTGVRVWDEPKWSDVDIFVSHPYPFQVKQSFHPPLGVAEVTFFHAQQGKEWLVPPIYSKLVDFVRCPVQGAEQSAVPDQFKLDIILKQLPWGYNLRYLDHRFRLSFRTPPVIAENPVENLTIAVDAGHGGTEFGAVGPSGLLEKDVNLTYATYLCEMLQKAGANAFLTRNSDTTLSLSARIEIAKQRNADLLIWCHNNSVGPATDPLTIRGTSIFSSHPVGKQMAKYMLPHLLRLGLKHLGPIQQSYYLTRQTDLVVLLVEAAFISHPEEEMLLRNREFLKHLATGICEGLKDFFAAQKGTHILAN